MACIGHPGEGLPATVVHGGFNRSLQDVGGGRDEDESCEVDEVWGGEIGEGEGEGDAF